MSGSEKTEELLRRVREGDKQAFEALFSHNRRQLQKAIALRMDNRLSRRVDTSDIVQETYMEAARRLSEYLKNNPMPFHLWLRWLAYEKIIRAYRVHLGADKRAIVREESRLLVESSTKLAERVIAQDPTASQQLRYKEITEILKEAFEEMPEEEKKILLWRHYEQLNNQEIASLINISKEAAGKRYIRALMRLKGFLAKLGISQTGWSGGRDAALGIIEALSGKPTLSGPETPKLKKDDGGESE